MWYGLSAGNKLSPESGEDSRCVNCGAKLEYDYVTYANLGGFRCPKCGTRRHETLVTVSDVLADGCFVISDGAEKTLAECALPGLYNIYNAAGVTALMTAAGVELRYTLKAVSSFECGFGRMEKFDLGKAGARMILIKMPLRQTRRWIRYAVTKAQNLSFSSLMTGLPTARISRGWTMPTSVRSGA